MHLDCHTLGQTYTRICLDYYTAFKFQSLSLFRNCDKSPRTLCVPCNLKIVELTVNEDQNYKIRGLIILPEISNE